MNTNILITRPEPENALSCAFVRQCGWTPVPLPMMSITPLNSPEQQAAIRSQVFCLDEFQFVFFVSKNAARLALEYIDECWPMAPINTQWIGIGAGTTELLKHGGLPAISNPGNTTEQLLEWLKPVNMRHSKVLIVRGQGGRPALADGLEAKGAKVTYLELYQRSEPSYTAQDLLFLDPFELIWATSAEGVENLTKLAQQHNVDIFHRPILVPSERVRRLSAELGWQKVICSNGADDQSLYLATKDLLGRT
ncbi:uroporphyrinogen-III synthase [Maribrevibacterium harenarium]|uniref:Uroporphyrinogen-III synthase n=1 Tax=Maribrevibacterium harenarium TaxID=2589817 RepID=A0A501X2R5_9GAMM|nr:uroporphyrinogen-III synthase [Maribrevibacterium harenarium]TPE54780.1 uroporphyrinogen-III synthase [Maribrevibacterium harenarium]